MTSGYDRAIPDGNYIILCAARSNKSQIYFLDIPGSDLPAANGSNVLLSIASNSIFTACDTWNLSYANGFYTIRQNGSDMRLGVDGDSILPGGNVKVAASNGASNQQFAIKHNGRSGYTIKAKHSSFNLSLAGSCSNGTNVIQSFDTDSDGQAWLFIPFNPSQPFDDGKYIIWDGVQGYYELGLSGDTGNVPEGENVQIDDPSALSQYNSFVFSKRADGYYRLTHAASGKMLNVSNGYSIPGTRVNVADDDSTIIQRWAFIAVGDGRYRMVSECNGYPLDADARNPFHDATPVYSQPYNFEDNQTWYVVKAEYSIAYDANGGVGEPSPQTKYYKQDLRLSTQAPTRDGYTFEGWGLSANADTPSYFPGDTYSPEQDQTLYAVWSSNEIVLDPSTTLYLPSDLIEIGDEAFSGLTCKAVVIPDTCTKIGERAFENCKELLYVYIPSSVTSIGDDAFKGCDNVYLDYQNE